MSDNKEMVIALFSSVILVLVVILLFLFLGGCTPKVITEPPLNYSYLPSPINLDSVKTYVKVTPEPNMPIPNVPDTANLRDFKSISRGDTILLSLKKGALYDYYKIAASAYKVYMGYYQTVAEANLVKYNSAKYLADTYYGQSKAAEILYQSEIVRLKKESKRSWVEKNMIYIGFVAGIATAILTEYEVLHISK